VQVSDLVIRAARVGKRYRVGAPPAALHTLRAALATVPRRIGQMVAGGASSEAGSEGPDLWAVRDLTFELARGEVLGIAGPNGSGKSTALRLASGITEPSEGWIAVRGRVATLLEVGTGFHPELTGRENILMSGIVLGMRAADVRTRFDQIVEFAGIGRFVDTSVKHYSSGMYMRLAFAVAVHLDADLLLMDEVLAVGDLEFQDKCLAKIGALRDEGRTVLFVTHNVSALRRLCTRALLMDRGRVTLEGSPEEVARRYEGDSVPARRVPQEVVCLPPALASAATLPGDTLRPVVDRATLRLFDQAHQPAARFAARTSWRARLAFDLNLKVNDLLAALTVGRVDGTTIVTLTSSRQSLGPGRFLVDFVCELPLAPADAIVGVELWQGADVLYRVEDAAVIEIVEGDDGPDVPVRRGLLIGCSGAEIVPG
jgi:ABC-type polysaccharide/polyol phosphate transport system ATPase subunit